MRNFHVFHNDEINSRKLTIGPSQVEIGWKLEIKDRVNAHTCLTWISRHLQNWLFFKSTCDIGTSTHQKHLKEIRPNLLSLYRILAFGRVVYLRTLQIAT